ncbi:MAG: pirin family protein [Bryobacteraceae bacterium]
MENKRVEGIYAHGSRHWVGDGFPVRNIFPSNGISAEIDPFLMLDYMGPAHFPPTDQPKGVGEHPHRGFETVTVVYQGMLAHRDSTGNAGVIGPGDVQWMTAASGVVHEEKHEREFARRGGTVEGVQLWVNLPREHKMSKPGYQSILDVSIPRIERGGGAAVRVIAGEWDGARGPARTFTPINVFDLHMPAGTKVAVPVPATHNAALVLLKGDVTVGGSSLTGEAMLAVLTGEGSGVEIEARGDSMLLVLSGEPIGEPVAQYGPFVMNTEAELRQAFEDYRAGKMGRLS